MHSGELGKRTHMTAVPFTHLVMRAARVAAVILLDAERTESVEVGLKPIREVALLVAVRN